MSGQDEPGVPMPDALEMDLRGRVTVLEERAELIFWLAVFAELGVIALAAVIIIAARKAAA